MKCQVIQITFILDVLGGASATAMRCKNTFLQYDVSPHKRTSKKKKNSNEERAANGKKRHTSCTHECGKWRTILDKTCVWTCATFSQANKVSTWNRVLPLLFTFPLRIREKKMANIVDVWLFPFFLRSSHLHTNEVMVMYGSPSNGECYSCVIPFKSLQKWFASCFGQCLMK